MLTAWYHRYVTWAAMCGSLALSGPAIGAQQEGVYQWRYLASDEGGHLHAADSDSTDNFGSITFACRRGYPKVKVEAKITKDNLKKFAKLIAEDKYPKIILGGTKTDPNSYEINSVSYSGLSGWMYDFDIEVESEALQRLVKTGSFSFTVADFYKDSILLKTGLEEASQFRKDCISNKKSDKK